MQLSNKKKKKNTHYKTFLQWYAEEEDDDDTEEFRYKIVHCSKTSKLYPVQFLIEVDLQ